MIGRSVLRRELTHDLLGEGARRGGQPQQDADIDVVHDVGQLRGPGQAPVRDAVRGLGEPALFRRQVRPVVGEQADDVDDPDPR